MRGLVIIFIGLVTTPLIVSVVDWASPLFVSMAGWTDFEVALTLGTLKFLWPIGFGIMGIISMVHKSSDYSDSSGPALYTRKSSYKRYKGEE